MTAPRRRWTFGLRTLFVVVTLSSAGLGWLGYNISWIKQRHRWLEEEDPTLGLGAFSGPIFADAAAPPPHPFPIGLRLLGEAPLHSVRERGKENVARLKKLFPEAEATDLDWWRYLSQEPDLWDEVNEALAKPLGPGNSDSPAPPADRP